MIEHLPKDDYEKVVEDGHIVTYCTTRQVVKHGIGHFKRNQSRGAQK